METALNGRAFVRDSHPRAVDSRASRRLRSRVISAAGKRTRRRTLESLEQRMPLAADVMISEIMYHPTGPVLNEYIELHNRGTTAADLTGWQLSAGVNFTFPARLLNPGQYLIVARSTASFGAKYPGVTNFIGNFTGDLDDDGETLQLKDAGGVLIDSVTYADQGDWASRIRGPLDRGHQGWIWAALHDGDGRSLELINPAVSNAMGQNWGASSAVAGTPGSVNSINDSDAAPLVTGVKHTPAVPRSTDAVTVVATLADELPTGLAATLFYRADGEGAFSSTVMLDDGQHGDGSAGDKTYGATILPKGNGTIVEFYVQARDAGNNQRTWPAPVAPTNQQIANALYQVDDTFSSVPWTPGSAPIYRLIMTAAERAELADIGDAEGSQANNTNAEVLSRALVNATFVSVDGTGAEIRYNVGVGNHGWDSAVGPPNDYRVEVPRDRPWKGQTTLTLEHDQPHLQALGSAIFQLVGQTAGYVTPIQLLVNGTGGSYSLVESPNSVFARRHFPGQTVGDLYTAVPDPSGVETADLRDEGDSAGAYLDTYQKQTRQGENDWEGFTNLVSVLNNTADSSFAEEVSQVIDVDQWLRTLALGSLLGDSTGLAAGIGAGYSLYQRATDGRFLLLPQDLDSIFLQNPNHPGAVDQIINAVSDVDGLIRLVEHADTVGRYYQAFVDLIDNVFNPAVVNPLIDQVAAALPQATRDAMKQYVVDRTAAVLAQIPLSFTATSSLPVQGGFHRTTSAIAVVSGTANSASTRSILVGGVLADFTPLTGVWSIGSGSAHQKSLNPGINRLIVEAMSGPNGTGQVVEQTFIDVWYDTGTFVPATPLVIPFHSDWKFLDNGQEQNRTLVEGQGLFTRTFADTGWSSGPAELGYGNNDEETEVSFGPDPNNKYITTYFRHHFTIPAGDAAKFNQVVINLKKDDGASIYINGREVVRTNLPPELGDGLITNSTRALVSVDNQMSTHTLTPQQLVNLLRDGDNVIAVEMHQQRPNSGDISFDLQLTASQVTADPRNVSGTLPAGETIWTPAGGPYHVVANVVVPATGTLTIQPGTTVYFDAGTRLTVNGVLHAEGTKYQRIRLTGVPGAPFVPDIRPELPLGPPHWDGVQIIASPTPDNIISYTDIELAQNLEGSVLVRDTEAILDHVSFAKTRLRMVLSDTSSLIIRDSVFPDMFLPTDEPRNTTPPLDNASEHIEENGGIPPLGHFIIERNIFGSNKGHNDIIDLNSSSRPDAILQIRDNVFFGGGDEGYDGGGDFLFEGNTLFNFIKDIDNDGTGDSNGASTGDGATSIVSFVRNKFYNFDHAINFKNDSYGYVENNTFVRNTPPHLSLPNDTPIRMLDFSVINLLIPNIANPQTGTPRDPAGKGAYTSGNIYVDIPQSVFGHPDMNPPVGIISNLEVHHSIVPSPGVFANSDGLHGRDFEYIVGDPRLVNPAAGDFRLKPGSPAVGTGPNGLDMGAEVPRGASISGEPTAHTSSNSATLTIGGPGIFSFVYRVNGGAWSEEIVINDPLDIDAPVKTRTAQIQLTNLADGSYTVDVLGRDLAGNLQPTPATSKTWTVDTLSASRPQLSELLVLNSSLLHEGTRPDMIEIYNAGSQALDLFGYRLSDDPALPTKYQFPQGTVLQPGAFLVVYADSAATSGLHTGFTLENGETVILTHADGYSDSVTFGLQLADYSIARIGHEQNWGLAVPSFGAANVAARTGDASLLKINEWFTDGQVRLVDDFIELFNPDSLPIDLGGFYLTDDVVARPNLYQIPPLNFIAASGFVPFGASGNLAEGVGLLPFELSADQGLLGVLSGNAELIEQVFYSTQTTDYSQGRLPDGSATFSFFALPTPGFSNALSQNPVTLAVIDNLRVTEIMYHPAGNPAAEYIELQNIGNQTLNLSGIRFESPIDFVFDDVQLGPGQFVLVVRDRGEFEAIYGDELNIAGEYSGSLSDVGDRVVLQVPAPLESAILRFSYDAAWYPQTAGQGRSLVIRDATFPADTWNDKASWRPSTAVGGSPGASDRVAVAGRHVFYNQSKFDGTDATANAADDAAIATDKAPLLPGGTSNFANYTSYNRGLNGLMVDIAGLPRDAVLTANDFSFRVGSNDTPITWSPLAAAPNVSVRRGAGIGGSDRVTLIWPTGAAIKQWLEVFVKPGDNTALEFPDLFYFGNAVGESGNVPGDYSVSITDELLARNNPVGINPGTLVTNRFDYNRDGTVSVVDQLLARNNITTAATRLKQITVPPLPPVIGLLDASAQVQHVAAGSSPLVASALADEARQPRQLPLLIEQRREENRKATIAARDQFFEQVEASEASRRLKRRAIAQVQCLTASSL